MTASPVTPDKIPSFEELNYEQIAGLGTLRLLLTGESVVDLQRFWFFSRSAVDRFLRLSQFDTDNPLDLDRLRDLHHQAVVYLTDIHQFQVPETVEQVNEIHDLFLMASAPRSVVQQSAAMVVKVMHVLHHIAGQELIFSSSVSEAELFNRLTARVFAVIDKMRGTGINVVEFSGGKKPLTSLVTKLLAKKNVFASHVFDKARFSITIGSDDDVVPALLFMANNLFPANYVVPDQSQNGIVTFGHIAGALGAAPEHVWDFWMQGGRPEAQPAPTPRNEFSGPDYRNINFIVDMPIRIDDLAPKAAPAIAFAQAEIQLVDQKTAQDNEVGPNAHSQYKERQLSRVQARLRADVPVGKKSLD